MKFDPQKHHRRSIRLNEYDYTQPGGYFITIVTYQRHLLLGTIVNKQMQLNDYGKIADACWRAIPDHFPNVELGAHVVMPNHIHGIIVIHENGMATSTWCKTKIDWGNCWIIQIGGDETHRART